jgi:hypothetical protein
MSFGLIHAALSQANHVEPPTDIPPGCIAVKPHGCRALNRSDGAAREFVRLQEQHTIVPSTALAVRDDPHDIESQRASRGIAVVARHDQCAAFGACGDGVRKVFIRSTGCPGERRYGFSE